MSDLPAFHDDGSATIIRSLPGFGVYLHITIEPHEVEAIRAALPPKPVPVVAQVHALLAMADKWEAQGFADDPAGVQLVDDVVGAALSVTEIVAVRDWAQAVVRTFPDAGPCYQVGSTLRRLDWRDVDVRLLLPDKRYDRLAKTVHIGRLNHALSIWGQQTTGLPIDFQVQRMTDANEQYPDWRNPLIWIDDHREEAR